MGRRAWIMVGFLFAAGVSFFPTRAGAYINAGFRSRAEYEAYLKRRGIDELGRPLGAASLEGIKRLMTPYAKARDHALKGEWKLAVKRYDETMAAAKFAPVSGSPLLRRVYYERGDAWWQLREYARALADYRMAVRQADLLARRPGGRDGFEDRKPYLRLAVAYAACPDPKLRDRAKSVALAEAACAMQEEGLVKVECESVLAALHAAAGDFGAAVRLQTRIIERLSPQSFLLETAKEHLEQYRQGKTVWAFSPDLTGPADPRPRKAVR